MVRGRRKEASAEVELDPEVAQVFTNIQRWTEEVDSGLFRAIYDLTIKLMNSHTQMPDPGIDFEHNYTESFINLFV